MTVHSAKENEAAALAVGKAGMDKARGGEARIGKPWVGEGPDTATVARLAARGRRLRSAYMRRALRAAVRRLLGRSRPAPAFRAPATVVPADEVEALLARNDNELSRLGVRRADLEAFRDGRLKVVRRRTS